MSQRPLLALRSALVCATATIALGCAQDSSSRQAKPQRLQFAQGPEPVIRLHDDTATILAQPVLASETSAGLIYVADGSDKGHQSV